MELINKKLQIKTRINYDNKILINFSIIEYGILCLVKHKYNYIAEIIFNNSKDDDKDGMFTMHLYSINKMGSFASNYMLENTYYSTC
jgi:hypothetical protein